MANFIYITKNAFDDPSSTMLSNFYGWCKDNIDKVTITSINTAVTMKDKLFSGNDKSLKFKTDLPEVYAHLHAKLNV